MIDDGLCDMAMDIKAVLKACSSSCDTWSLLDKTLRLAYIFMD